MKRNLITVGAVALLVAGAWVMGQQVPSNDPPAPAEAVSMVVDANGYFWVLFSDGTVKNVKPRAGEVRKASP